MKKIAVIITLLAFVATATAQSMADKFAESVATYLSLDASQKAAVLKLYKAEQDKQMQKRQEIMAKQSDKTRAAREKAQKSKENRPTPKASGKARNVKPAMSVSERYLMIAYGKAESNPALKQALQKIFTRQQAVKWEQLSKK